MSAVLVWNRRSRYRLNVTISLCTVLIHEMERNHDSTLIKTMKRYVGKNTATTRAESLFRLLRSGTLAARRVIKTQDGCDINRGTKGQWCDGETASLSLFFVPLDGARSGDKSRAQNVPKQE